MRRSSCCPASLLLVGTLAMASCDGPTKPPPATEPTDPPPPISYAISDATHSDGNRHFFFLPPLVPTKPHNGEFDPDVNADVVVCRLSGDACASVLAAYSRSTGSGGEVVRVSSSLYTVVWHTDEYVPVEGQTYRIYVRVLGTILGFADVQIVASRAEAKNVVTGETFPLLTDRSLPISFRIEKGAVFVLGAEGGTVTTSDGKVQMVVPPGAVDKSVALTVNPARLAVKEPLLVEGAVYDFGPSGTQFVVPIEVSITYDPAMIPAGASEQEIRLHMEVPGAGGEPYWKEMEASSVDLATHTVKGLVPHFTRLAARVKTSVASIQVDPLPPASVIGTRSFGYHAFARDARGNLLRDRTITATTGSSELVSPSTVTYVPRSSSDPYCTDGCYLGSVSALDIPETAAASVTLTSEGVSTSFSVMVEPRPVQTVTIGPLGESGGLTMRMYEESQLTASLADDQGQPVTNRQLSWSGGSLLAVTPVEANGSVVTVAGIGRGTGELGLTIQGSATTATVPVTVRSAPAARLEISPAKLSLPSGEPGSFTVRAWDAKGVEIPDAPLTWALGDATIAEMTEPGVFIGIAPEGGATTVTVESEGVTAAAELEVAPEPVTNLVLSPSHIQVTEDASVQVTAVAVGKSGVPLTRPIEWTLEDNSIAQIGGTGRQVSLLGLAVSEPKTSTLTATSEGVSASVPLTVHPLTVTRVEVVHPLKIALGNGHIFEAIAYHGEKRLTGRTASWTSLDPAVATVGAGGVVTPVKMGTVTLVATFPYSEPGVEGRAEVEVVPPPLQYIQITTPSPWLVNGETSRIRLRAIGLDGRPVSGVVFTVASSPYPGSTGNLRLVMQTPAVEIQPGWLDLEGMASGAAILTIGVEGSPVNQVRYVYISPAPLIIAPAVLRFPVGLQSVGPQFYPQGGPSGNKVWTSGDPDVVNTTGPRSQFLNFVSEGIAGVTGEDEYTGLRKQLTVYAEPVTAVQVSTATPRVQQHHIARFTAIVHGTRGAFEYPYGIRWTSSDPQIATVEGDNVLGQRPGTVTITGTSFGESHSVKLTVDEQYLSTSQLFLGTGGAIRSPSGAYRLMMQTDCNLVLYNQYNVAFWSSGTPNTGENCRLAMQGDGNLVVYRPSGTNASDAVWASGSQAGSGEYHLTVADDGKVVIWRGRDPTSRGEAIWSARGVEPHLTAGQFLDPNSPPIQSPNARYRLVLQQDCNLVLYDAGAPRWASGTPVNAPCRAYMQGDGNLVIYRDGGTSVHHAVWASGSGVGPGDFHLSVTNDGRVIIWRGRDPWSRGELVWQRP